MITERRLIRAGAPVHRALHSRSNRLRRWMAGAINAEEASLGESTSMADIQTDDRHLERQFLLIWLGSAAVVSAARLTYAGDLGYDLTFQIQAAQNLLAGLGLSHFWPTTDDLAAPQTLINLTHFPAGYSLYAALLMRLGADASTVVKVLGAAATMTGWWGWARLALTYMGNGVRQSRAWRAVALWTAAVSPLLFTAPWAGTDIVLWAAVPWVLGLVTRPPERPAQARLGLDVLAGVILGLCVFMRYASLYLVGYAALVIAGQYRTGITISAQRLAALAVGLLPALVTQFYINNVGAVGATFPGGVDVNPAAINAGILSWHNLATVGGANNGLLFWMPERVRALWNEDDQVLAAIALAVVLFVIPAGILIVKRGRPLWTWCHDVRIVSAGLLLALPIFLWTAGIFGGVDFLQLPRHHWSVRPLAVFIAFFIATDAWATRSWEGGASALRWISRTYIVAFLFVTAAEVVYVFVPTERGDVRRLALLGNTQLRPWPTTRLNYEFSPARKFVLDLMKAQPDATLITTRENWFYADPKADRWRIMRWEPCEQLRASYVNGPARLILFVTDTGGPVNEVEVSRRNRAGTSECLDKLPDLKLVRQFPDEQMKVLEAEIPAGRRVQLKPIADLGRSNPMRSAPVN